MTTGSTVIEGPNLSHARCGSKEIQITLDSEAGRSSAFDFNNQPGVSAALAAVLKGKFCELLLVNRKTTVFKKHAVIYDVGNSQRTLFFLRSGFVKIGSITRSGREVVYDVRKAGDVVGELCVSEQKRLDRAVALETTEAIGVPYTELKSLVMTNPDAMAILMTVLCEALKGAYSQISSFAVDNTAMRLTKVLVMLTRKIGRPADSMVEIPVYLTQEDLAQMAASRRERLSTALNELRRRGIVKYSESGKLLVDLNALRSVRLT